MKRALLIIIFLMLLATGCANKNTVPAESTVQNIANDDIADTAYSLSEIIIEINGTTMLLDGPKGCFSVPMQKLESSPEPQVGDILEVTYDGRIEELYPSVFPGIISLKVYKPVEMTAVITDFGTDNNKDIIYFNPVEFSSLNSFTVTDWKEYIPTGPDFEIGDEIVVTYSGIADEENPAGLCNVVKIDLSDECYTKKYGDKFKPEIDATVDNYISLPLYVYSGNDGAEKAIIEYFEDNNYLMKPEGSVWIPAFCILMDETVDDPTEADAKKGDIKVYGNFWSFVYSKQGDTLFCESGGEYPGVVYLKKNDGQNYEVTYFDQVGDGSQYSEDIKRICNGNASLEKQFYESADANSAAVKNIRTWNIYKYVKDNNLDIKYYQDYGWDPVDFNMEVNSWGNRILDTEDDSKEKVLSGEPRNYSPFAASEMHDLKLATLLIDGKEYSITDAESLKWIEDSFRRTDEIKGWPNCPYDAELILVRADGSSFRVEVATDSCNNIKAGDIWYTFHSETGDNTPLYDLFGIKVLFGKIIN